MKAAVKENNLPENKERIEAERDGLRFAKVAKKDRPLLPDEALDSKITFSPAPEYDSEKLNLVVLDEVGMYIDCSPDSLPLPANWKDMTQEQQIEWEVQYRDQNPFHDAVAIPYDRGLTGDAKHDMMQDLVDFGRCASITDEDGTRRLDPMSDEVLTTMANAAAKGSSHTEIYDPEEVKRIWEEAKADARVQEPTEPSPWQGDAPEGTVAHKLKYGEFYKKDIQEPR